MTAKSILTAIAVVGLATISNARSASAADYHHLDEMALDLQRQSREVISELRAHYRHAPQYRHMLSDTANLFRQAAHVHAVAHAGQGIGHLNSDLTRIDQSFHHLQELFYNVEHHVRHCRNPRCGHFHGDTRHVRRLINSMEDTIHHLKSDVRRELRSRHHRADHHRGRVVYEGRAPHRGGIEFGGRGFRVGFGF